MAKFRIHNSNGVDSTYEADNMTEALAMWAEEFPDKVTETIHARRVED